MHSSAEILIILNDVLNQWFSTGAHGTITRGTRAQDLLTVINHLRPVDGWELRISGINTKRSYQLAFKRSF